MKYPCQGGLPAPANGGALVLPSEMLGDDLGFCFQEALAVSGFRPFQERIVLFSPNQASSSLVWPLPRKQLGRG